VARRDYSAEYEARNEAAQERGYDSFYEMRAARESARDELGSDAPREQIWEYADFQHDFAEGDWSRDDLRDVFDDFFPDGSDEDFYDWLQSMYEQ
jgi:hypothetical protein